VARIILAAGGDERTLRDLTSELGLRALAPILVHEIVFRANSNAARRQSDEDPEVGRVVLVVRDKDDAEEFPLAVHATGKVAAVTDAGGRVAMSLELDLHDLIRTLFGPVRRRPTGVFGARLLPEHDHAAGRPDPDTLISGLDVNAVVVAGLSRHEPDLSRVAAYYQTDKWGGLHWFTELYVRHFQEFRDLPLRILEIGVGGYGPYGGASLRTWKRYFPRALVFGVDILDKSPVDEQRIATLVADQGDPDTLIEIDDRYGPFDIVIDDGSHINEHIQSTFRALFPRLRRDGLYVVEDLWTTYRAEFGGAPGVPAGPTTSVAMLKELVESIQHEEHGGQGERPDLDRSVVGLHVYHNIAFIEKGTNAESGIPQWVTEP
jgi:demethylmacrocin O-methyltransferase